ncbi:MAG: Fic family protein [Pigmentiphaga sp.]|nr:Fic family protein [Pigmentiphaga sp.]
MLLEIHPFQDGNSRLSRVLNTLLLLRAGYAYVPYSVAGKRDRAEPGSLLSGTAAGSRQRPHRRAEVAALAGVLPA